MKFFKWFAGLFKRNPQRVRIEISLGPIKRRVKIAPNAFDEFMKRPEDKRCVTLGFPAQRQSPTSFQAMAPRHRLPRTALALRGMWRGFAVVKTIVSPSPCIIPRKGVPLRN